MTLITIHCWKSHGLVGVLLHVLKIKVLAEISNIHNKTGLCKLTHCSKIMMK